MGFQNFEVTRKSDPAVQRDRIAHTLDEIRRVRSDGEFATLVRALNIVACAFRPLTIHELIEALATDVLIPSSLQKWEDDIKHPQSSQNLKWLCVGFLDVRDSGVVSFSSDAIKHFVSSGNLAAWKLLSGGDGHENLAIACIRHLQYLDPGTILEPEQSTQRYTTPMRHKCALLDYVINFWHRHSRIADAYSRYVPAILHETFVRTITGDGEHQPTLKERIDTGLWLSTFHGFRVLCKTYLEMGADPNSRAAWHASPIHTAAKVAKADIARLLLDRGGDLALRDEEGLTPLQIALDNGNFDAANVLIEAGLGAKACEPSANLSPACTRPQLKPDGLHEHPNVTEYQLSCSRTEVAACHFEAPFRIMDPRGPKAYGVSLIELGVDCHRRACISALRGAHGRRNELMIRLRTKGLATRVNPYRRLEAVVSNLSGSWCFLILQENCASYNFDKFSLPRRRRRVLHGRMKEPILQLKSSRDDIRNHVDHKLGMIMMRWSRLFWAQRRR
jgi:hypothetical protein